MIFESFIFLYASWFELVDSLILDKFLIMVHDELVTIFKWCFLHCSQMTGFLALISEVLRSSSECVSLYSDAVLLVFYEFFPDVVRVAIIFLIVIFPLNSVMGQEFFTVDCRRTSYC